MYHMAFYDHIQAYGLEKYCCYIQLSLHCCMLETFKETFT